MLKKYSTLTLMFLMMNLFLGATVFGATTNEEKDAKAAEKVKTEVTKLGTGKDARVEVKLKDGTKLKGYVSEVKDASFVLMNEKTASLSEVPYPQAKQVKGHNLGTGAKIAIGIGIGIGVIVVALFIATKAAQ